MDIIAAISRSDSTTYIADRFRDAAGLPHLHPKHKRHRRDRSRYERLMHQRIGALDRAQP